MNESNFINFIINDLFGIPTNSLLASVLQPVLEISIIILISIILFIFFKHILKVSIYKNPRISQRQSDTLYFVLYKTIKKIIIFLAFLLALNVFVKNTQLLVAITSVSGIAIGFAAQDIIKDIITGFFFLAENQFSIGDIVEIEDKIGTVEDIGLRTTIIRSLDGKVHIFPNGYIKYISNASKEYSRCVVEVGISYKDNVDQAIATLRDEMSLIYHEQDNIINEPNVVGVVELGDSSVVLRTVAETTIGKQYEIAAELRRRIKIRFDKEGITIPFPQRDIHHYNHYLG